jgi:carbon storage regulator CsrA
MLVLTRRIDEEIVIGEDIRIRVVEAKRGRVRLGISAPDSVHVLRAELLFADDEKAGPLPAPIAGAGAQ